MLCKVKGVANIKLPKDVDDIMLDYIQDTTDESDVSFNGPIVMNKDKILNAKYWAMEQIQRSDGDASFPLEKFKGFIKFIDKTAAEMNEQHLMLYYPTFY